MAHRKGKCVPRKPRRLSPARRLRSPSCRRLRCPLLLLPARAPPQRRHRRRRRRWPNVGTPRSRCLHRHSPNPTDSLPITPPGWPASMPPTVVARRWVPIWLAASKAKRVMGLIRISVGLAVLARFLCLTGPDSCVGTYIGRCGCDHPLRFFHDLFVYRPLESEYHLCWTKSIVSISCGFSILFVSWSLWHYNGYDMLFFFWWFQWFSWKMKRQLPIKGASGASGSGHGKKAPQELENVLKQHFGYSGFRGKQLEAIEAVLSGALPVCVCACSLYFFLVLLNISGQKNFCCWSLKYAVWNFCAPWILLM